jgi:serine acetyltransferase
VRCVTKVSLFHTHNAALSGESSAHVGQHIKAAFEHNDDLSQRVLWCLDVDWRRACRKVALTGRVGRLFHLALCWEWWAVANYRFTYWVLHRRLPFLGRARMAQRLLLLQQAALLRFCYATSKIVEALSGARLNGEAEIGPGLLLAHTGSCGIGRGVVIGHTFTLYPDANVMGRRGGDPPTIGDNVTVYSGARVIGPVKVGDGVRVGANAVVLHDLPAGCMALGVPARPVTPGGTAPPYPAAGRLYDLLLALLEQGDVEEVSPGSYRDSMTGTLFTMTFDNQDTGEISSPPWRTTS